MLSPVPPAAISFLNRSFVSSAVPKPANIRIVHSRPRWPVGWMPRVNGGSPGRPRSSISSQPGDAVGGRAEPVARALGIWIVRGVREVGRRVEPIDLDA